MLAATYLNQVSLLGGVAGEETVFSLTKLLPAPGNVITEELEGGSRKLLHTLLIPAFWNGRVFVSEVKIITAADMNGNQT